MEEENFKMHQNFNPNNNLNNINHYDRAQEIFQEFKETFKIEITSMRELYLKNENYLKETKVNLKQIIDILSKRCEKISDAEKSIQNKNKYLESLYTNVVNYDRSQMWQNKKRVQNIIDEYSNKCLNISLVDDSIAGLISTIDSHEMNLFDKYLEAESSNIDENNNNEDANNDENGDIYLFPLLGGKRNRDINEDESEHESESEANNSDIKKEMSKFVFEYKQLESGKKTRSLNSYEVFEKMQEKFPNSKLMKTHIKEQIAKEKIGYIKKYDYNSEKVITEEQTISTYLKKKEYALIVINFKSTQQCGYDSPFSKKVRINMTDSYEKIEPEINTLTIMGRLFNNLIDINNIFENYELCKQFNISKVEISIFTFYPELYEQFNPKEKDIEMNRISNETIEKYNTSVKILKDQRNYLKELRKMRVPMYIKQELERNNNNNNSI